MQFTCEELLCVSRQVPKDEANDQLAAAIVDALNSLDDERDSYVIWESICLEDDDCGIEIAYPTSEEDGPSEEIYTVIVGYFYEECNYQFPEGTEGKVYGKMPANLSMYEDGLCQVAMDEEGNEIELECLDSDSSSPVFVWIYLGDELLNRFEADEVECWSETLEGIL